MMNVTITNLKINKDERGWLAEIFKNENFGQVYTFVAKPRIIRGKHYHKRKTEFFCFLQGTGILTLVDIRTEETKKIKLSGDLLQMVEIKPFIAHKVENTNTKDLHVLAYINETYNPEDPDTFSYEM